MGKSDEKRFGRNGCDIGRVEIGIPRDDSLCETGADKSTEAQHDPWALKDLVDTSEKWSGKVSIAKRNISSS